jgi:hypothetical protein
MGALVCTSESARAKAPDTLERIRCRGSVRGGSRALLHLYSFYGRALVPGPEKLCEYCSSWSAVPMRTPDLADTHLPLNGPYVELKLDPTSRQQRASRRNTAVVF